MKYEYIYDDEDVFIDYSWERAFSIYGDVYLEWCLEFFSMMYFDRGVDRTRADSKERCQKRDMWMMSSMEELRGINLAWVIFGHLCKHASGLIENSLICKGHYVTKIDHSLGYLNDEKVEKCSEPIECEIWTLKMLANELDEGTHSLMQTDQEAPQPRQARRRRQEPTGLD
uniref:Uncharacterized protein n=1 Tax=Tanacetum cinerariifolium TaxID=118510 RepID=A0A6L2KMQ2_TANCI|nr:hypothetical protein [Tanacetum cinerariifolium]